MDRPKPLDNIDFSELKKLAQEYIDFLNSAEFHEDNDYDHYLMEKALETIYGECVWDYINSKL